MEVTKYQIEERKEVCSVATKLVSIKIYRLPSSEDNSLGEIADFECSYSSSNCETRCTYKMLLNDF